MQIDEKTVKKLSTLARIHIKEEDYEKTAKNLEGILNWAGLLEEANTQGVEPMFSVCQKELPLRKDEIKTYGTREEILLNAPLTDSNKEFFAVKKVIK